MSSSSRSCLACHISTQGLQRPVAGRIALYAGCFLHPSTRTLNNLTCFSGLSVFIVKTCHKIRPAQRLAISLVFAFNTVWSVSTQITARCYLAQSSHRPFLFWRQFSWFWVWKLINTFGNVKSLLYFKPTMQNMLNTKGVIMPTQAVWLSRVRNMAVRRVRVICLALPVPALPATYQHKACNGL